MSPTPSQPKKRNLSALLPQPESMERPFEELPEERQLIVRPSVKAAVEPGAEEGGVDQTSIQGKKSGVTRRKPGRPPAAEKQATARKKADKEVRFFSIRIGEELDERIEAYINNPYAMYRSKVDLFKFAVVKALDELEPVMAKFEKVHNSMTSKEKK